MKNIDIDFKNSYGKSILFLGRVHSLTKEEIEIFLEKFDITYTDTLNENVKMVIESTIISPLEEEIAYEAYKKKIPSFKTEEFEKLYALKLNSDSILMSLKLSNNQDRLFRLLRNNHLEDRLFIKLFRMYDWGEDGLFESSENMEVCTLFAKRFYKKDRFDPATFHSPISIFEIAIISKDADVLEALFTLPQISVKQSRRGDKRPVNIKEALATNEYINSKTLDRLLRLDDRGVDYFLAQNSLLDESIASRLLSRADADTKIALSLNKNLSDSIFEELLKENFLLPYLLFAQKIDRVRFSKLKELHHNIGANENLSHDVIELLIEKKDIQTLQMLSSNNTLGSEHLQKLYELKLFELFPYLASNKNLPINILKELYTKNDFEIDKAIAINKNATKEMLEELYNRDVFEINEHLALNESTKIEHLQQLQLDTRLMNNLKDNRTFTENILNNLGIR